MITTQDRKALTDISIIIQMMPISMREKINDKFIEFIENNKSSDYVSTINKTIPLRNQQLSQKTQEWLALIYRDCLCSPDKRNEMLQKEKEEFQNEKPYKFKFDTNESVSNEPTTQTTSLIVSTPKSIFFKRILNKIKNWFKTKS